MQLFSYLKKLLNTFNKFPVPNAQFKHFPHKSLHCTPSVCCERAHIKKLSCSLLTLSHHTFV